MSIDGSKQEFELLEEVLDIPPLVGECTPALNALRLVLNLLEAFAGLPDPGVGSAEPPVGIPQLRLRVPELALQQPEVVDRLFHSVRQLLYYQLLGLVLLLVQVLHVAHLLLEQLVLLRVLEHVLHLQLLVHDRHFLIEVRQQLAVVVLELHLALLGLAMAALVLELADPALEAKFFPEVGLHLGQELGHLLPQKLVLDVGVLHGLEQIRAEFAVVVDARADAVHQLRQAVPLFQPDHVRDGRGLEPDLQLVDEAQQQAGLLADLLEDCSQHPL